ncbi:hypothetical protein [Methanogenium sp. MK-MG]|uniref:hypothetical protein n=1 Tax=Methanogenium sp. MK-MG TaxID=2599926 RepID=UPI0013ECB510|nr:hypothetical protein [Methanogenium sp. MK-MG]KAF1076398.1 hypothetical protein MKMG_01534 [Methanogenium sp. MK-MG]
MKNKISEGRTAPAVKWECIFIVALSKHFRCGGACHLLYCPALLNHLPDKVLEFSKLDLMHRIAISED